MEALETAFLPYVWAAKMTKIVLLVILALALAMNLVGNTWGLPDRWNPDEVVADSLRMMSLLVPYNTADFYHPTLYYFFLGALLAFWCAILMLFGVPVFEAARAARVSWIYFSQEFPQFASSLYLTARSISAVIGVGIVYLVYRSCRALGFKKETCLGAAALLACAPGFVVYAHFAKSTMLVLFLQLLTLYLLAKFIKKPEKRKYVYYASMAAGLALATKYDAAILVVPLAISLVLTRKFSLIGKVVFLYAGALMVGWPALLMQFKKYFSDSLYYTGYFEPKTEIVIPFYVGALNYVLQLAVIFSLGLFIVAAIGVARYAARIRSKGRVWFFPFAAFAVSYFIVVSFYTHFPYAYTKYIIAIAPCLAIFSAFTFEKVFAYAPRAKKAVFWKLFLACAFVLALFQISAAHEVFLRGDTRYAAGRWIESHASRDDSIELLNIPEWIAPMEALRTHEILFLGASSKYFMAGEQFKESQSQARSQNYFRDALAQGPRGDYVCFAAENPDDIFLVSSRFSNADALQYNLVTGKYPYVLAAVFVHPNHKVRAPYCRALSYPQSFLKAPNFSVYTSPTVFIYKRTR